MLLFKENHSSCNLELMNTKNKLLRMILECNNAWNKKDFSEIRLIEIGIQK